MYQFLRKCLFTLEPEVAHHFVLSVLSWIPSFCFAKSHYHGKPIHALGLEFPHPIGLSAGLDKNGEYLQALQKLGFSFIEIGTVTPKPQTGNPKPRLFRLPKAEAFINRMGFNNLGVDYLVKTVSRSNYQGILGINIGKNKDTSLQHAVDDYRFCLQQVFPLASYVTVNISSPNTPDLRLLQQGEYFEKLMQQLREEQLRLSDKYKRHVPLVIKLSPDESDDALKRMANVVVHLGIEGIIATNTTNQHALVEHLPYGKEAGGLSGPPLRKRSTECIQILKQTCGDAVTLIGVGGIDSTQSAQEKLKAGASLLQVYTGLIYHGPSLVTQLTQSV